MKLNEYLESVWQKDPKGANSVAHLSFLLSTKWSHRRKGRCYRKEAESFIHAKAEQHRKKVEEYHREKEMREAAYQVGKSFFAIFMDKAYYGTVDEDEFIKGLEYEFPTVEKKKPVTITAQGMGNPFLTL